MMFKIKHSSLFFSPTLPTRNKTQILPARRSTGNVRESREKIAPTFLPLVTPVLSQATKPPLQGKVFFLAGQSCEGLGRRRLSPTQPRGLYIYDAADLALDLRRATESQAQKEKHP